LAVCSKQFGTACEPSSSSTVGAPLVEFPRSFADRGNELAAIRRRWDMTRSVRTAAILIAAALFLVGIKVALTLTRHPSDETLIQQALNDSLEASRKGQPGGVLDLLSKEIKVNQQTFSDSSSIAGFIRNSRPDITLTDRHVLVTQDEARIVSPVDLSLLGQSWHLDKVTLVFHREEARGFLFLPTTKWQLTEVRLPENQLQNFSG
jgi:hypothetical protein